MSQCKLYISPFHTYLSHPCQQLIGAGFTGFGSYLIHLGNKYNFDALAGDQFLAGTGVLASAGGLILITGVIGAAGAVLMWRSLLVIVSSQW